MDPLGVQGGAHPPGQPGGCMGGGVQNEAKSQNFISKTSFFIKSVTFHLILLKSKHMLPKKQKALTRAQNL